MGMPSAFEDHAYRLVNSYANEYHLREYLKEISGNPNYDFPRSYNTIRIEFSQLLNAL